MSNLPSVPPAQSVPSYVADGARIAAILLVWGALAAFFTYGVSEIGLVFETVGPRLGELLAVTGLLNAVLFVLYRAIDYRYQYANQDG